MTKRAILYARVSTEEQAEQGYSLPSQFAAMRKYAANLGYEVAAEISDDYSGATLDRPGMARLRAALKNGEAEAVIVYDPDRLSRDDVDFLVICREWERLGVELHFVNGGELPNSPEGDILRYLMGWKGKRERAQILERTSRGRRSKAEAGRWVGIGFPPYGYERQGEKRRARLLIYEPEASIVRLIFQWYTQGDETQIPLSLRAIAERLDEMGAAPPNHRRNAAQHWIPATLRGILTNEIYIGQAYYGKTKMVTTRTGKKRRVKQERETWIPIDLPELAIADLPTFAEAQARIERNKELARRNRRYPYLLSGFFRCTGCGSAMGGSVSYPNGYEAAYYRCGNHHRKPGKTKCFYTSKTIAVNVVETIAWDWVVDLFQSDEKVERDIMRFAESLEGELQAKRERLAQVEELITEAEQKVRRLARAFGDEKDETVAAALRAEMKVASRSLDSLKAERETLCAVIEQGAIDDNKREYILQQARKFRARLSDPTIEQKRSLLDAINFRAKFRIDETGRWLDVTCGLTGDDVFVLPLWLTSSRH